MLVRRSFGWRSALLLGAALGATQLVRGFNLWLVPIVVVGLPAATAGDLLPRRQALSTILVVLAATAVAGPWYVRQTIHYSNPLAFNRSAPDVSLWRRRPVSLGATASKRSPCSSACALAGVRETAGGAAPRRRSSISTRVPARVADYLLRRL